MAESGAQQSRAGQEPRPWNLSRRPCFEAQQAAEKATKSLLIARGIDFPYVHDLTRLLSLLEEAGEDIPETVLKAGELTPYALLTRYPGPARPVTEAEYAMVVEIAEAVVHWAAARS